MSAMLPEDVSLSLTRSSTMPAVAGSFRSCGAASARPPRNSPPKRLINCSILAFDSRCFVYRSAGLSSQAIFRPSSSPCLICCWIHKLVHSRCRSLPSPVGCRSRPPQNCRSTVSGAAHNRCRGKALSSQGRCLPLSRRRRTQPHPSSSQLPPELNSNTSTDVFYNDAAARRGSAGSGTNCPICIGLRVDVVSALVVELEDHPRSTPQVPHHSPEGGLVQVGWRRHASAYFLGRVDDVQHSGPKQFARAACPRNRAKSAIDKDCSCSS